MTKTLMSPLLAAAAVFSFSLAACGGNDSGESSEPATSDDAEGSTTEGSTTEGSTTEGSDGAATSDAPTGSSDDGSTDEPVRIAFFGFANANGFAQATWSGIQAGAEEVGAEVEFFDPNFDSNKQISQIQDAITTGEWDAFIVQANDGNAIVPVVEEAIAAGIPVVGEFTPIGTDYSTVEPQIDGLIFVGAAPTDNGKVLAEMALDACADRDPCNVAYLEGSRSLPLDSARTAAFTEAVEASGTASVIASVEGGYTQDTGLAAAQDVFVANDVDVMVGSSQAVLGAEQAMNDAGVEVDLIGNGGPRQAVAAVKEGRWYGVFFEKEVDAGLKAFELAYEAATGGDPETSVDTATLATDSKGTAETLADEEGQWDA